MSRIFDMPNPFSPVEPEEENNNQVESSEDEQDNNQVESSDDGQDDSLYVIMMDGRASYFTRNKELAYDYPFKYFNKNNFSDTDKKYCLNVDRENHKYTISSIYRNFLVAYEQIENQITIDKVHELTN